LIIYSSISFPQSGPPVVFFRLPNVNSTGGETPLIYETHASTNNHEYLFIGRYILRHLRTIFAKGNLSFTLSTSEEKERIEYVSKPQIKQQRPSPPSQYEGEVAERREKIIHRHTNTGALIAIIVGILILMFGLYLVFTRISFITPTYYANWVFLIIGFILLGVGAKIVASRAR
jgi:hypothetical protein